MNRTIKAMRTVFLTGTICLAVSACAGNGPPAPGYSYGEPGYGSVDLFYGNGWGGDWHHGRDHGWHDHGGHGWSHAAGHGMGAGFAHGGFGHGGGGHGGGGHGRG